MVGGRRGKTTYIRTSEAYARPIEGLQGNTRARSRCHDGSKAGKGMIELEDECNALDLTPSPIEHRVSAALRSRDLGDRRATLDDSG